MEGNEFTKEVELFIEEVKNNLQIKKNAYKEILDSFKILSSLPIITFDFPIAKQLFRARINTNSKLFNKIEDISFPKECFVKKYARANKPSQSVFYGSEDRPTSYLELVNYLAETTAFGKSVIVTIGSWKINRKLKYALIFNPEMKKDSKYSKKHGDAFDHTLKYKTPS